jgi:hypothetical protein
VPGFREDLAAWHTRYSASASEVLDLLVFTRPRHRSLLKTLLETGYVAIELPLTIFELPVWDGPLTLDADTSAAPETIFRR